MLGVSFGVVVVVGVWDACCNGSGCEVHCLGFYVFIEVSKKYINKDLPQYPAAVVPAAPPSVGCLSLALLGKNLRRSGRALNYSRREFALINAIVHLNSQINSC